MEANRQLHDGTGDSNNNSSELYQLLRTNKTRVNNVANIVYSTTGLHQHKFQHPTTIINETTNEHGQLLINKTFFFIT